MKKIASILLIVALVGVIVCFAACGNNDGGSLSDDMTTLGDKVTSMLTEGESKIDEAESDIMGDMTGNIPEDGVGGSTSENGMTDTTDKADTTDEADTTSSIIGEESTTAETTK